MILITGLLCLLATPVTNAQIIVVPRYEIYLAVKTGDKYIRSKDHQFGCDDTIYLFLESSDKSLPGVSLDAVWKNAASGLRHETSNPFTLQKSGKRYWSWSGIEFHPGGSGPLNLFNMFLDPAAGREKFIGEWKVYAEVEGRYQKQLDLKVLC
ncbi:MAG: hypothetical protein ACR2QW_09185 [bacterium]